MTHRAKQTPASSELGRAMKRGVRTGASLTALVVLLALSLVPVALMLVWSLRNSLSIQFDFWALPRWPQWTNYGPAIAFLLAPMARTLYVAAASIAAILACASLAAYAFARLKFFGKEVLFYLVLVILLVPGVLTLTPSFALAVQLGVRNSLEGLIVFYAGAGQAFAIFLLRAFFQSQPEELFEAARLDGADEMRLARSVAVPLAAPTLITVAIMSFLTIYNDFIWPLLMLVSKDLYTVTIVLQGGGGDPARAMAGYVVASVPLLLIFLYGMDYYIEGLSSGALRA